MLILTATEFQIRLNVERLTITVERKNAMRCVGKVNAVRERMQCGDFIGAIKNERRFLHKVEAIHRGMKGDSMAK